MKLIKNVFLFSSMVLMLNHHKNFFCNAKGVEKSKPCAKLKEKACSKQKNNDRCVWLDGFCYDKNELPGNSTGGYAYGPEYDDPESVYYYPSSLTSPPMFWIEGVVPILHGDYVQRYETPIAVYSTMILDQIMWNCVASFHSSAASIPSFQAPAYKGDSGHFNSKSRVLCMVHAINKILNDGLLPDAAAPWAQYVESLGFGSAKPPSNSQAYAICQSGQNSPKAIGHCVSAQMIDLMKQDGWNFDGSLNRYGEVCTANCIIYGDNGPVPFQPVNNAFTEAAFPRRWQPLLEHNDKGFVVAQGHITPHIGKVSLQILKEPLFSGPELERELDDPGYDYEVEADLSIEEVAMTGKSDFRKMMVEFMDNKINLAGGLIMRLRSRFHMSVEQQLLYHVGYTTVEHDSVVLAWKEKVRSDLVRPTSVVQRKGDTTINSWRGPGEGTGQMKARDWTPYIRTMPHSEFPSGSGCICTVVADYVEAFTKDQFGISKLETTWKFPAGSSKKEPGMTPATEIIQTFQNMQELKEMCGDSRIWGGMHFRASVPESYKLCKNIGEKAYTGWVKKLIGFGSFPDLFPEAEPFMPGE